MRSRLLLQVDATDPALATSFAELVLRHCGPATWLALRIDATDARRFTESPPVFAHAAPRRTRSSATKPARTARTKTPDADLHRLLAAGAFAASRLRCPAGEPITDAVFGSRLFQEYSAAVLLIGSLAPDFPADLRVFVGTPSVATLHAPVSRAAPAAAPPTARKPAPAQRAPRRSFEDAIANEMATIRELVTGLLAGHTTLGPALAQPFAAATDADVLVLDAHTDAERRQAAALGAEFEALRRAMLRSRPRKAHVVDLGSPKDAGSKRLLAAVKRALASARS